MWKLFKAAIALLLLPLCFGMGRAIFRTIQVSGRAETVWVATGAGAACWTVIYALLPKPMKVYVFGHELSHALWTWLFGGKVKRFKATAKGGHVVVTRTNFLIALAPYFFPIYAVAVVLLFLPGHLIWDWTRFLVWFHLALGAAYAFHVTLTWHILQTNQSDITEQGYLFSAVVIWLGNAIVLLLAVPLLTGTITLQTAVLWSWTETRQIYLAMGRPFGGQ